MPLDIDDTRRKLGELAVMADRTAEDERRIMERAQELLNEVEAELKDGEVRRLAVEGDEAAEARYEHLVSERGRLNQVIATARQALESAA